MGPLTSFRYLGLLPMAILAIAPVAAADAGHPCAGVPKQAEAALQRSAAALLGNHSNALSDWEGRPVQLRGALVCRDAVAADFDGNGSLDVVGLYDVGDTAPRALLMSAFRSEAEWRSSVIEIVPGAATLALLPPGDYPRNPTLRRELRPAERAVVMSHHAGVAVSVRPRACLAFFLGEHRWVFTETSCP